LTAKGHQRSHARIFDYQNSKKQNCQMD